MGRLIFCDTYALVSFVKGNDEYKNIFENYEIVMTNLNQIELFYIVLKDFGLEKARELYHRFNSYVVDFDYEVIELAMIFKLKNKDKKLSYADCIGYAFSNINKIKFLTGDKEFKDFPGVEFVKA